MESNTIESDCTAASAVAPEHSTDVDTCKPAPGDHIEIYRPLDNTYYPSMITKDQNGIQTVVHGDGKIEMLDLSSEKWCYASSAQIRSIRASSIRLKSNTPGTPGFLDSTLCYLGQEPSLKYQTQAFPYYVLINVYLTEADKIKQTVCSIFLAEVPKSANIISSHTI